MCEIFHNLIIDNAFASAENGLDVSQCAWPAGFLCCAPAQTRLRRTRDGHSIGILTSGFFIPLMAARSALDFASQNSDMTL